MADQRGKRPLLVLVDYEAGNLRSITQALEAAGAQVAQVHHPDLAPPHDGIVLPGVGAFDAAMERLTHAGFPQWILERVEAGVPLLGICLGIQLLFERSEEGGKIPGLGLLRGDVRRLPMSLTVPHMGWNQLDIITHAPLLEGVPSGAFVYFVHSYVVFPKDQSDVVATTDYGGSWPSIVVRNLVIGLQFHPEKSGPVGQQILRNFIGSIAAAGPKLRPVASGWKSSLPST
jgi:glutamine amidotransferase